MTPSQTTSTDTPMKPLHPVLQAAIASLDVDLETELTRYRRSRYGQSPAAAPAVTVNVPANSAKSRSLDLIDLPASSATANPPVADSNPAPPIAPIPPQTAGEAAPSTAIPPLFSAANHLGPTVNAKTALMVQPSQTDPNAASAAAIAPGEAIPDLETGYLESSAHLLHELDQAEAQADKVAARSTASFAQQIFTPLGIGSMLLLLVSSIALGYAIANPGAIAHLETVLGRSSTTESDPADAASEGLASDPLQRSGDPDLATEEFVNLDLGTLSTLPGTDTPPSLAGDAAADNDTNSAETPGNPNENAPANSLGTSGVFNNLPSDTSESVATNQTAPRTTVPRPAPLPQSQSTPNQTTTASPSAAPPAAPTPAASEEAAIATAPSPPAPITPATNDNTMDTAAATTPDYYYVVVDYAGDPSLAEAQTAVNDAYVRNFEDGARIQMGAFNDADSAAELVDRLADQGIAAEVKEP